MRKYFFILLIGVFFAPIVEAQYLGKGIPDGHDWIDYSKSYLRIKIAEDGIYRLSKSELNAAGMTGINGSDLVLYNLGEEVTLKVSNNGSWTSGDYVEFYGHKNNGDIDKPLYMDSTKIPNPHHGYLNDTNVYFMALIPGTNHKRYTTSSPNFNANTVTRDYFYDKSEQYRYANRSFYPIATTINTRESTGSGNYYKHKAANLLLVKNGRNQNGIRTILFTGLRSIKPNVSAFMEFVYNPIYFSFAPGSLGINMTINNHLIVDSNYLVNHYLNSNVNEMFSELIEFSSDKLKINTNPVKFKQTQSYYNADNTRSIVWSIPYCDIYVPTLATEANSIYEEFYCMAGMANQTVEFSGLTPSTEYNILNADDEDNWYVITSTATGTLKFKFPNLTDRTKFVLTKAGNEKGSELLLDYSTFTNIADNNSTDFLIVTHSKFLNSTDGAAAIKDYEDYRKSVNGGSYNVTTVDIDDVRDNFGYGFDNHPLAMKGMMKYMYENWSGTHSPHCLIICKGISPEDVDFYNSNSFTFPYIVCYSKPGGDLMFADLDYDLKPKVAIGRIPAKTSSEISTYLDKVIEYEQELNYPGVANTSNYLKTKLGMHLVGIAPTEALHAVVYNDMNKASNTLSGPKISGRFPLFVKGSSNSTQSIDAVIEDSIINQVGVNWIAFYGHSSPSNFSFNLSPPENMNNAGKYFHFFAFGCTAGNQYITSNTEYLSEKYVFQDQKASVTFSGTSSNGWTNVLGRLYNIFCDEVSDSAHGKTVGELTSIALSEYIKDKYNSDFSRIHVEQWNLCGDPAIKFTNVDQRDYSIESKDIVTNPSVIDGSQKQIKGSAKFYNFGIGGYDSVLVSIIKQKQDGTQEVIHYDRIAFSSLTESVDFEFSVDPLNEIGLNRIIVEIDPDNEFAEMTKLNNKAEIQYKILSGDIIPAFPYEFAIVNYDSLVLRAYTIDPMAAENDYYFELDTTELFNSPFLKKEKILSRGGILSWEPGISMTDSTVYYWRTRPDSISGTQVSWKNSSFVYLPNSSTGWNQSHYYQFLKNKYTNLSLDPDRVFRYDNQLGNISLQVANILAQPSYFTFSDLSAELGSAYATTGGCNPIDNIHFIVVDSVTGQPWLNTAVSTSSMDGGRFNSLKPCSGSDEFIFAYAINSPVERKQAMDFIDSVPDGHYIALYNALYMRDQPNLGRVLNVTFASDFAADTLLYGAGNSLYHKLQDLGFAGIDSFYKNRPFCFFTQKGIPNFPSEEKVGIDSNDAISATFSYSFADAVGSMQSPPIGTSYDWSQEHWRGTDMSTGNPTDSVNISITELDSALSSFNVYENLPNDTAISFIDKDMAPYLRLKMTSTDNDLRTPNQLDYWRINYEEAPDLALDPATVFELIDSAGQGQLNPLKITVRNLSHQDLNVDSVDVLLTVRGPDNNTSVRSIKIPAVNADEAYTMVVEDMPTQQAGNYYYGIFVNNDQKFAEQTFQNNSLYGTYSAVGDDENPLLDVTFDDIHIINEEIVSPTPEIVLEVTDDNKYLFLNDTSLFDFKLSKVVQGTKEDLGYNFSSPEVNFIPAVSDENKAFIELRPTLDDGDYVLDFNAKDRIGNGSRIDYSVKFKVVTKSSITHILNYPNPFTTSTRFVFTLTGSKIPENMMIQIYTVTGKMVKEIKYNELGPLHIGTNITDYAWDGRDAKGDPVANGVYLYRVRATIDGNDIEHRATDADNAFVEGIGKMYIVR